MPRWDAEDLRGWVKHGLVAGVLTGLGTTALVSLVTGHVRDAAIVLAMTTALTLVLGFIPRDQPEIGIVVLLVVGGGCLAWVIFAVAWDLAVSAVVVGLIVGVLFLTQGLHALMRAAAFVIAVAVGLAVVAAVTDLDDEDGDRAGDAVPTGAATVSPTPTGEPTPEPQQACWDEPPDAETEGDDNATDNNQRSLATGPVRGGQAVKGRIDTSNDRDWLFFCMRPGRDSPRRALTVTVLSPTERDECYAISADVKSPRGKLLNVNSELAPEPGTAAEWRSTLAAGGPYGILITGEEAAGCRWQVTLRPPGALIGDPTVPSGRPCVPETQRRAVIAGGDESEPNDAIDEVNVLVAGPAGKRSITVRGAFAGSETDWLAFCTDVRLPMTIRLHAVDAEPSGFADCSSAELDLRGPLGQSLDVEAAGERADRQELRYTPEATTPYYVVLSSVDTGRCRWELTVDPADVLIDTATP